MQYVPFDFKTFQRNDKPNSYLVCPDGYCHTKVDLTAPTYHVTATHLENAWEQMIANQPRTKLIHHSNHENQFQYVQRSLIFRFPDYINIKFIPLGTDRSTLAIYSHSVYGHSDFGVNKKRIDNWLAQLQAILAK